LIYIQAENEFGITGGSNKYLIDLSYKVFPQFTEFVGTMVVLISESMTGTQTYNFAVNSDVTSIKIKNAKNFPYLTVSMNGIVIDKT
jgi:hypothetical protein